MPCSISHHLLTRARRKDVCLFVGSGISRSSGIPTVLDVYKTVFEELYDPVLARDMGELYRTRKIPFEGFMQRLLTVTNDDSILSLFVSSYPNHKHRVIAKMLQSGLMRSIITTNFDTLIEQALLEIGWIEGKHYTVSRTDADFRRLARSKRRLGPHLAKIHGCSKHVHSVKVTLEGVASRIGMTSRLQALHKLVHDKDALLFAGYSFSDRYDVNIELRRPRSSQPRVWVIRHRPLKHRFACVEENMPALGRKVTAYDADSDIMFKRWAVLLQFDALDMHVKREPWVDNIRSYLKDIGAYRRSLLSGELLFMVGKALEARKHFEDARKVALRLPNWELLGALQSLAKTFLEMRSAEGYAQARTILLDSRDLARRTKDRKSQAMIEHHLGIERMMNRDQVAMMHFKKARFHYQRLRFPLGVAKEDMQIATMYRQAGRNALALRYYRKSLVVRRKHGDIEGIGLCYHGIGNTYFQMKRYSDAAGMYRRMLSWYEDNYDDLVRVTDAKYLLVKVWNEWGVKKPILKRYLDEILDVRANLPSKEKYHNAVLEHVVYLYRSGQSADVDVNQLNEALEFYEEVGMFEEHTKLSQLKARIAPAA